ncbi:MULTISPECIES: hotdog fold thioesterase [unclassified Mesorhizobium]|uniref:PaaI family thioesterase n=1 Tax=unclassified Mesorhizobium TaxID=325217 RepID=UPI0009FBA04B
MTEKATFNPIRTRGLGATRTSGACRPEGFRRLFGLSSTRSPRNVSPRISTSRTGTSILLAGARRNTYVTCGQPRRDGALQNLGSTQKTATLESKTNFVRPCAGARVTAECRPIHLGRQISVWQTVLRNEDGKICAYVWQTQIHIDSAT